MSCDDLGFKLAHITLIEMNLTFVSIEQETDYYY